METVEDDDEKTNLEEKGGKGGAVYTRWGSTTCPEGTRLLYQGRAGATKYNSGGGAANYLCMPDEPEYDLDCVKPGVQGYSEMHGVEYQWTAPNNEQNDQNVPCAVCFAKGRVSHVMIPARLSCPNKWTLEYTGYLMSTRVVHIARTMFECVDKSLEVVRGEAADKDGGKMYNVESTCNGLECPPYYKERELACVVCTR